MTNEARPGDEQRMLRDVTVQLGELAAALTGGDEPLDVPRMVDVAAASVPHGDHVGVTYIRPNKPLESLASSDEVAELLDEIQAEMGEGPCIEAAEEQSVQRVEDLISDRRWPEFAAAAYEKTGVRSIVSVRLILDGDDQAALNFYASEPEAFTELDLGVGAIFASFISTMLNSDFHRKHAANLETALQGSRQIGTAIGILMARKQLTSDEAFAQLREASQHLNRKLRDIADYVNETGELPGG